MFGINRPRKYTIKDEILLEVDKRLNRFHKEMLEFLINSMPWNRELGKMKLEIMKPYLDEKYAQNRAIQAEKINQSLNTKGEEIRKLKEEKYNEYIKLQREGRDFVIVKAQYDILQALFGEVIK